MSLVNTRFRRWLPLAGVLLVPLAIAGLLTWSLGQPGQKMKSVKAAIVNNDKPVTINGQLTPLGRQLSAQLVGGQIKSNYTWEFATPSSASEGLKNGTYAAVVTIPANFSAAATSFSRDPKQATHATIGVATGDRSHLADQAVSRLITADAVQLLDHQLTTTYLDNIYVGFNTLGDKLGDASHGATSLSDGAQQLAGGTDQLSTGADKLADGSRALAGGMGALNNGATQLSHGTDALSNGLAQMQRQTAQLPQQTNTLANVSTQESHGVQQLGTGLQGLAQNLNEQSQQCQPVLLPMCQQLAIDAATARALSTGSGQIQQASNGVSTGLNALAGHTPNSGGGLPALATGIGQTAQGAAQLDNGTHQLAGGLAQADNGATQLAGGAGQLATGAHRLSGGARQLGDGDGQLSSGLTQAVRQLPHYGSDRGKLAQAVANPVAVTQNPLGFGSSDVLLYAVLALWGGAMATFLVLRAVPDRALESTRSSIRLAAREFRTPVGIGIAQAVLVSVIVGVDQGLAVWQWFATAGLLALAAVSFTAINHGLTAAFGGVGRLIGLLVALVALATGFIAAVPGALNDLASVLPLAPAQDVLRAVLAGTAPGGGMIAALVVWAVCGFVATWLAIERRRTVRAMQLSPHGTHRPRLV